MANKSFLGSAPAIQQVTDYTFGGTWESGDLIIPLIGTKSFSTAAGSTVTNTVVDNVFAAWNALSSTEYQEFAEITASRSSSNLRLTADTAGKPFTVTISTTESDGSAADAQTIAAASVVTASSGPNDWSTAANWTSAAVPVNSDSVYLENSEVAIKYGLDQSGVTLTLLDIAMSFTADIGLPRTNTDGTSYAEYRATYLAIGATTLNIGTGEGTGSGRIKIDTGSNVCTLNQYNSGQGDEFPDLEAVLWKGTHASNEVNVYGGSLGIARFGGESATVLTLRVQGSAVVYCGAGCTLGTVTQGDESTLTINSAVTNLTMTGGTCLFLGTGALTAAVIEGGTLDYRSSGTITDLEIASDATIDFSGDDRPKTVTNCIVHARSTIRDPDGVVTFTNGYTCMGCRPDEVNYIGPKGNVTMTPTFD